MKYAELSAEIISITHNYGGYLDITIRQGYLSGNALPGQFILMKPNWESDPFLGRPFDIVDIDDTKQNVRVIVKIKGHGTEVISRLRPGNEVPILGPLGNPVDLGGFNSVGFLVRGVGAAAVTFLARRARDLGKTTVVFISANTASRMVCLDTLNEYCSSVYTATDDGSEGYHGNATDLVDQFLLKKELDAMFTCGSKRFARYTGELEKKTGCRGFVFLEGHMACGVGNCHGCAVKKRGKDGYLLVCKDGPVFPVSEVVLE